MNTPKLYLIPNTLDPQAKADYFSADVCQEILKIRHFIVEERPAAERLLKRIDPKFPLTECRFLLVNEHTALEKLKEDFKVFLGNNIGIISEAGCPCVADPGAGIVYLAHQSGYEMIPFVGPSSILLALMASGLPAENFAFNGYLPREPEERKAKILELEKKSFLEKQTQVFMETPYRNQSLFSDLLAICKPQAQLCIAADLMGNTQKIKTQSIAQWRQEKPDIHKKPVIFVFSSVQFHNTGKQFKPAKV